MWTSAAPSCETRTPIESCSPPGGSALETRLLAAHRSLAVRFARKRTATTVSRRVDRCDLLIGAPLTSSVQLGADTISWPGSGSDDARGNLPGELGCRDAPTRSRWRGDKHQALDFARMMALPDALGVRCGIARAYPGNGGWSASSRPRRSTLARCLLMALRRMLGREGLRMDGQGVLRRYRGL